MLYDFAMALFGDNTYETNFTKASGILSTENSIMQYNMMVHISGIRCYNGIVQVYVSPNANFHGSLFLTANTANGSMAQYLPEAMVIA